MRYSHARAAKALGLEVSAPTGHKSTTLPDISESSVAFTYVEISIALPRPTVPSMLTPATSWEKRTHLCGEERGGTRHTCNDAQREG